MNYNNGATGAMGQSTCPDWWRLSDVASAWHVPLNTLHRLVAEKYVQTKTIGGEEFVDYLRVQRGVSDLAHVVMRWKREARGEAAVQPLSTHTFKPLSYVQHKTGLAESVVQQLIDTGEIEGMVCPLTGAQHVVWHRFDQWWRHVPNQRRARNMSANAVAAASATKVKEDAEKQTAAEKRAQMLADGRERVQKRVATDTAAALERRAIDAAKRNARLGGI
jgi:hypothetical protein